MNILVLGHYYESALKIFGYKGHLVTYHNIHESTVPVMIDLNYEQYDMAIIHPDCTLTSYNVENRYISKPARLNNLMRHCEHFNTLLSLPIEKIVIENPVLNKFAKQHITKEPDQLIDTNEPGRKIGLWLKNMEALKLENMLECSSNIRREFYFNLIQIMADQWL